MVSTLISAEEDSKYLEIPAENLFDIATRVLKDMNMYMIEPRSHQHLAFLRELQGSMLNVLGG
ncbi:MAG: hypothetical protein GQ576_03270 [Methanococcoides sp.]|nr:hypothetical protein [Methanococcoides sp.]